jgi:hypothetical protein
MIRLAQGADLQGVESKLLSGARGLARSAGEVCPYL